MSRWTVVDLDPWEYEHAHDVGIRRFTANWGRRDAAHYDRSRMEDDRTAQAAAALCELAVAKHLNLYWPGHVWPATDHNKYRDCPDIPPNIEVKRIRGDFAAVRRHQVGRGMQLWVARVEAPEMRRVALAGWLDYDQAWAVGAPSDYSPDSTRVVHYTFLNPADHGIRGIA